MTTMIEIQRVSKRYMLRREAAPAPTTLREALTRRPRRATAPTDDFWALRDISFKVEQGERLGIVGRNGAGKSTLLKILSRIVQPSSGHIGMRGRVASLLEVGTGFHPELTGRENIFLNGAILGMSRNEIRRRFDEIVAFSEVERFLETPVKHYSSGMYVRLAFSVAAHLEPEILIVDEVLAVGDLAFQKKCLGKLQDVGEQGRTVIFVSHNLAAINQLCTTGVLLDGGKVQQAGPVAGVVSAYLGQHSVARTSADLHHRAGRPGSGGVQFLWARLLGPEGQPLQTASLGEDLTVEFGLELTAHEFGNPVQLSVLLRASDGTPLANLTDLDERFQISSAVRQHTVRVRLSDLRLYPDTYFFSLWAGSDYGDQTYDFAEDCLGFDVVDGGQLTSRRLNLKAGRIFLSADWSQPSGNAVPPPSAGLLKTD
ncbi:ABC transporter ATP-binding protein [Deinococcus sp. QL22]|uniref:ABC transporter ATP-binding protein n=1 Tax=Deinococcus sp. QL22 TaxID=2939437 RepID=UPI00201769AF|nr:ABC transporter ATP-binding protein [Deinococcus sp. QL22]UQN09685.1 ABC transporter ATP-binding protein [Deinococcus sp. QL22]